MKTLESSLKRQKSAMTFWKICLVVSILLIGTVFLPEEISLDEAAFGLAFIGIVTAVISFTMVRVYKKRKILLETMTDTDTFIDFWECPDRYESNKGQPVPAYFSKAGFFYMGQPFYLKSYECTIVKGDIIDDEGPALAVTYTTPSTRSWATRHKSHVNIPIPADKMNSAMYLSTYYSNTGNRNA